MKPSRAWFATHFATELAGTGWQSGVIAKRKTLTVSLENADVRGHQLNRFGRFIVEVDI
jgi:hypothetical protein